MIVQSMTSRVVGRRNRDVALARAFGDLAGGLVGDVDVPDVLHHLAEHCVTLLEATACGILLADDRGPLRLAAASPERAEVWERLQLQEQQGPGVDCVRTGQPVHSVNLVADLARWPRWAPAAVDAGIRSVYATPLRTADTVIGALNLFDADLDGIPESDLLIVRALTDVATLTLLQQRRTEQVGQLNTQLQTALASRIRIEQAKGIVAHALGGRGGGVRDPAALLTEHQRQTRGPRRAPDRRSDHRRRPAPRSPGGRLSNPWFASTGPPVQRQGKVAGNRPATTSAAGSVISCPRRNAAAR